MKKNLFIRIVSVSLILCAAFLFTTCEPVDPNPDPNPDGPIIVGPIGTLEVEFRIPHSFLPANRVLRADLSLAVDAEHLYQGNLSHVANVYNNQLIYQFKLAPGNYYYKAGVICLAGGDSCSAAGFPGGLNGMKWAIGTVTISENETVHVVPQFTQ